MASSGNFATLNPLQKMSTGTFSNGNLTYALSGDDGYISSMALTTKSYCEIRVDSQSNYGGTIGFRSGQCTSYYGDTATFQLNYSSGYIRIYKGTSNTDPGNIGGTVSTGDIVMMAYDPATFKWWVGVNGTWRSSGDPAAGNNPVYTGSATQFEDTQDVFWGAWKSSANGLGITCNFGQDSTFGGQETAGGNADGNGFGDFKYSVPSGFLALCSANLSISDDIDPAQTDDDYPGKNFGVVTYTGNGSTQSITGLGFQPDLVWLKSRSNTKANALFDSNRGVTKYFSSDSTATQTTDTSTLTAFGADGFSLASPAANNLVNGNGFTYVGWAWKAGGSASSDSSGDITVSRSTNSASKFTIATWTGNGTSGQTIPHGLGVKPAMTFIKKLDATSATNVWHQGNNDGDYDSFGELSSTAAWYQNQGVNGPFSAAPGTEFLTLTAYAQVNGSSNTYVGYFWADVEGMQKFGLYEGNGNADGPFVYTGFRPSMLFLKISTASNGWFTYDKERDGLNGRNNTLSWQDTTVEDNTYQLDILSNGFKVKGSNNAHNQSGQTFLYGAWADVPFKYNNTF